MSTSSGYLCFFFYFMRSSFPFIACITLLLAGAAGCSEKATNKENNTAQSTVPVTQTSQQEKQPAFSKTFSGNIDGKYGITMNLTRKGNDIVGNYFYNKVKQPIAISGSIDAEGTLTLEETDAAGKVTGIFEGTLFSDTELTGKWSKPDSDKQLSFSLKVTGVEALTSAAVEVLEHSFSVQGKDFVAEFSFPTVKGNINEAALKKINQQLSVQHLTEETEEEIKKNFTECSCGLVNSQYVVNYNQSSILSITVLSEWVAAYSSHSSKFINIHTLSGDPIKIEHILKPSALGEVAALADKILQERIAQAKQEASGTDEAEWVEELLAGKKFEKAHLQQFTIHDNGLSFYYPFNFPHAALALEPEGAIGFTFEQLATFVDPNGLLAKEIK
jgi:hypothetical protein